MFSWRDIDCVILDMDGTLLDLGMDNRLWYGLLPARYAERHALALDAAEREVRTRLEGRRGTLAWYCFETWSEEFGLDLGALEYELETHIRPRPGALEFLAWLDAREVCVVLATNAHPASLTRKLRVTGIARFFDHIVSAHELDAAKEQPEFWERLETRLDFARDRCLFIDDSVAVRASARRHGIRWIFGIARPDSSAPEVTADDAVLIGDFADLYAGAAQSCGAAMTS